MSGARNVIAYWIAIITYLTCMIMIVVRIMFKTDTKARQNGIFINKYA